MLKDKRWNCIRMGMFPRFIVGQRNLFSKDKVKKLTVIFISLTDRFSILYGSKTDYTWWELIMYSEEISIFRILLSILLNGSTTIGFRENCAGDDSKKVNSSTVFTTAHEWSFAEEIISRLCAGRISDLIQKNEPFISTVLYQFIPIITSIS